MIRKIGQICLGGLMAISFLLVNVLPVEAAMYITPSMKTNQKLGLWYGSEAAVIEDDGTVLLETSVDGNVISVKMTVENTSAADEPVINGTAVIELDPIITDNFDVSIVEAEGFQIQDNGSKLVWVLGAPLPKGEQASVTYTLTGKAQYREEDFSNTSNLVQEGFCSGSTCIYIAKTIVFSHGDKDATDTPLYNVLFHVDTEKGYYCLPAVKISFDTPSPGGETDPCKIDPTLEQCQKNPQTGIFTDIIILSAIVVAAVGVLVITLKSNKFTKI